MSDQEFWSILNRAFLRIYRSFGMYLRDAAPVYDIGDPQALQAMLERQRRDAEALGTYISSRTGRLDTGVVRIDLGDLHFCNMSRILPEWLREQEAVVAGLTEDRKALEGIDDPGVALLDTILANEREHLAALKRIGAEAEVLV